MSNTLSLAINGMSCGHCVASVERALKDLPEVESAVVVVGSAVVTLSADARPGIAATAMRSALEKAGYDATVQATMPTNGQAKGSCCSPQVPMQSAEGSTKSSRRVTELATSADASI